MFFAEKILGDFDRGFELSRAARFPRVADPTSETRLPLPFSHNNHEGLKAAQHTHTFILRLDAK